MACQEVAHLTVVDVDKVQVSTLDKLLIILLLIAKFLLLLVDVSHNMEHHIPAFVTFHLLLGKNVEA